MSDSERAATWALLRPNKNGDGAPSDGNPSIESVGESYGMGYPARVLLEAVSGINDRGLDQTTEAT